MVQNKEAPASASPPTAVATPVAPFRHREGSVGAATHAFYRLLQASRLPTPFEDSSNVDACDKKEIEKLPAYVELGVYCAIVQGKCSKKSIGKKATAKIALVEGNVVALYNAKEGCFLRLYDRKVDYLGGKIALGKLPFIWDSERFLVVGCASGGIALYSPSHKMFVGIDDKMQLGVTSSTICSLGDCPRGCETFLWNESSDGAAHFTSMHIPAWQSGPFVVVQIKGIM